MKIDDLMEKLLNVREGRLHLEDVEFEVEILEVKNVTPKIWMRGGLGAELKFEFKVSSITKPRWVSCYQRRPGSKQKEVKVRP